MEDLGVFSTATHDLKDDIRTSWLRYLHSVKLAVVEVDSVSVMCLAHLAAERLPLDADAELTANHVQLLPQPSPQASQVDISD